jgi:hypothetical protein
MTKHLQLVLLTVFLFLAPSVLNAKPKQELDNNQCLAEAIYHEAGGEPVTGQIAVGEVVMNRVASGFASTVCDVISQHKGTVWQFSWYPHHKEIPQTKVDYFNNLAELILTRQEDAVLSNDVIFFTNTTRPFTNTQFYEKYTRINNQIFYTERDTAGNPFALKGTLESLMRQNDQERKEGLTPIQDDDQLMNMESSGELVPIQNTQYLTISSTLPIERRYCRWWTAVFLYDASAAYYKQFHKPLIVDSAVRTVDYQQKLMKHNRNAAPIDGDITSPHLTGIAVDISKGKFTRAELNWMRNYLISVEIGGTIDAEEEFHQRCFHISVYKEYATGGFSWPEKKHLSIADRYIQMPMEQAKPILLVAKHPLVRVKAFIPIIPVELSSNEITLSPVKNFTNFTVLRPSRLNMTIAWISSHPVNMLTKLASIN